MCGIVGYIGNRSCVDLVFQGLKTLEYRGYDSVGMVTLTGNLAEDGQGTITGETKFSIQKTKGKLKDLEPLLKNLPAAHIAMAHTRWATHGAPTTENAHPHGSKQTVVVHNGIIENYKPIKEKLLKKGYKFTSKTDTEVIVHLLDEKLKNSSSVLEALQKMVKDLKGTYALGILTTKDPTSVYLVRQGSPNVIGVGDNETFFASGITGFIKYTKKAIFMDDDTIAKLTANTIEMFNFKGEPVSYTTSEVDWVTEDLEKQEYEHYMLKEIFEQPKVLSNNIFRLVNSDSNTLSMKELGIDALIERLNLHKNSQLAIPQDLPKITDVVIVGCGTALHVGMVGKYFFENTNATVSVEYASEFRYRKQKLKSSTLLVAISQSGETADTLACMRFAKENGCPVFSICNVRHSTLARESDAVLFMDAGHEIGVAATKSFTSQVLCLYLFSQAFQLLRSEITLEKVQENIKNLKSLPSDCNEVLKQADNIKELADTYSSYPSHLFIGRGPSYPIALEGALKLKEISYIHAEGTTAGELKHGIIALIDEKMPIIALAPQDHYYEKTVSNVEECLARSGIVLVIGDNKDTTLIKQCHKFVACPHSLNPAVQAILTTIPVQLYAYYSALKLGRNIDQPRNLAKSVTVE